MCGQKVLKCFLSRYLQIIYLTDICYVSLVGSRQQVNRETQTTELWVFFWLSLFFTTEWSMDFITTVHLLLHSTNTRQQDSQVVLAFLQLEAKTQFILLLDEHGLRHEGADSYPICFTLCFTVHNSQKWEMRLFSLRRRLFFL